MTLLALLFFTCMVMFGGFAVDLMRYEADRTHLQNSLDRAALASASLNQTLTPQAVVNDYLEKEGLEGNLQKLDITIRDNSRSVSLVGRRDTRPIFLHMLGIDELDAVAGATAVQSVTNIELSLVLDLSGSMKGQKMTRLKTAASEFVRTVLQNDTRGRVSIALVPYSGQVNLGPVLRSRYNVFDLNGAKDSDCIDLPAESYNSTQILPTTPLPQTAFVDSQTSTTQEATFFAPSSGAATPRGHNRWCDADSSNIVHLPTRDIAALQSHINGLTAVGPTSINMGMKWGLALLDPGTRPIFDALRARGEMPPSMATPSMLDRPADFTDRNSIKVVVVMTDGEHFPEQRIKEGFRAGPSNIWRSAGDGNYSIFHSSSTAPNNYWVPHLGSWAPTPWDSGAGTTEQTWQEIWPAVRTTWVAWQLYGRALGVDDAGRLRQYNTAMRSMRSEASVATMDSQLQTLCNLAKAQNVVVYGIAFEAPRRGEELLKECASSPAHYFDAEGLEISSAFRTIASNLTMLKLTQ